MAEGTKLVADMNDQKMNPIYQQEDGRQVSRIWCFNGRH